MSLNFQTKIIDCKELDERIQKLQRPLVFTNGCFDILHLGHVTYLEQARNLGAALIVAVNTDESVKRQNKGDDRPINTLLDRMSLLASLECVDAVTSFDDDTPLELIKKILPDHLAKGGDWKESDIVGADIVKQHGGKVHSIEFAHQRSTTALLERVRSS